MNKILLLLLIALLTTFLLAGCSAAPTVTVTGPTTTVTATPPPQTITTTATATTTVTATATVTVTPTSSRNPYQGSLSGTWSGIETIGVPSVSGSLSFTIDANGVVQGTFVGSYSGTIAGQVDINGNLSATGTASLSGFSEVVSWQGKLFISGKSLSAQGTWSDPYGSGTFSATGFSAQ